MREAFSDIVGNDALRARLLRDISGDRFSHAYVLEGPSGSGKHMLALRIAAALSCENRKSEAHPLPCASCPSCRKILSGNSPDVIYIHRGDKATLGVEAIRAMHGDVYIAPHESEAKVYVIEDAHLLTPQAQNAFLLTLEEPPAYVCFLLLCQTASSLLETVRSRAPTLRMELPDRETVKDLLCRTLPEASLLRRQSVRDLEELILDADGSIGVAMELVRDGKLRKQVAERRQRALSFVRLCQGRHNSAEALQFLQGLGQKRDEVTLDLCRILLCLRDLLLYKQSEQAPLCFFADCEEAAALSYGFSAPELLRLSDCINTAIERLRMNANVRLTLTGMAVQAGLLSS